MNALQIALMAAQIFSTVEPIVQPLLVLGVQSATKGIEGLISSLQAKKQAGVKMTFREISQHASEEHGVDMAHVYRTAATVGVGGLAFATTVALRALRK